MKWLHCDNFLLPILRLQSHVKLILHQTYHVTILMTAGLRTFSEILCEWTIMQKNRESN